VRVACLRRVTSLCCIVCCHCCRPDSNLAIPFPRPPIPPPAGIAKFKDDVGRLWNALANYYVRLGQFAKAADIFEEGCASVMTVRDFAMIFDAYSQLLDRLLAERIERAGKHKVRPLPLCPDLGGLPDNSSGCSHWTQGSLL